MRNSDEQHSTKARTATEQELYQQLIAQGFKCWYTGEDLTVENSSIDHVNSHSKGGSGTIENLRFVLKSVNAMKGDMSYDEFVQMCKMVARHTEARDRDIRGVA